MRRTTLLILAAVALLFAVLAPAALAQTEIPGTGSEVAPQPDGEVLTGLNVGILLLSFVTNCLAYLLNHYAPWISQQAKGAVVLLANVAMAALYQIVSAGDFGWNTQTLIAVVSAVISAAIAHGILKPTGIATAFGAGTNSNGAAQVDRTIV